MINYGFTKELNLTYGKVIELLREALKKEGFGVLTKIDIAEKKKEKPGIDMSENIILGARNPPNAYQAILIEENIGLLLPCNVIVYEKGDKTVLSAIRPTVAMQMVDNAELKKVSVEVEGKLKRAFDAIK
ncbi:MAG: ABC transporter ATP-binding protein [Chloroflexi bacterium HGW-Chloroflexi-5]|nr:MAG: ABC transporter ATP-binding protein [Deltaproteobacteria bacterium HGW-Deltaproteobacteria-12]PKN96995.1 MAG: ABC transporter ATP-binding protein [Chloroflexi bacterium HGW-Chloroflexi-5]